MKNNIEPIARLIGAFQKLPGVGQKTAQRYALKVVNMSDADVKEFAECLINVKNKVKYCSVCGNFTQDDPCELCRTRDNSIICVVKDPKDVLSIERIRDFNGVYHVLHGVLNPMEGVGPNDIRIKELV
ncbi:MAG: recombination protein RecR, partial [Clostridia bacterium]|nr:recombination protein RecR [Clostridia bacterium]